MSNPYYCLVMALFASRDPSVRVAWLGTGRRTRTTLLHWLHTRYHCRDHNQRIKPTSDIQRS